MLPRALAMVAWVALWLCVADGTARAQTVAGAIVGLGGQVSLDRAGQRYTPKIGDAIYVDDALQVSTGGKLRLRMSDGSILSLASGTSMRIDAYALDASGRRQSASMSIGQGLLRPVTAPAAGPATFEVNTAVGASGVRSTDWFVEAAPGYQQVAVLSGSAYLTSRSTGRSVTIPAGAGTRLPAGGDPARPRPLSQAEFAALIAQTDGVAAPGPAAPAPPGGYYYPSPPGPYPYTPPGVYVPPAGIQIPGGGGHRDRDGRGSPPSRPGSHVPN
jgi:hypothetical protein